MRIRNKARAVGLGLTLAFGLAAAQARAAEPAVQDEFAAIGQDAAEYAKTYKVSQADAMRRIIAQQASVPFTDALAKGYADRLAGLYFEHEGGLRLVVLLTGDKPLADQTITAAGLTIPVTFRTGAKATRRQIIAAIDAHQADIRAELDGPPGLGVDVRTGAMLVVVKPSDAKGQGGAGALADKFAALTGVPVEIRTFNAVDANLSAEGGGRLIGPNPETGKRNLCTAGFVVTDGTHTALSTAAHCPDSLSLIATGGDKDIDLTIIGAFGARYQDVQIHSAAAPMAPLFVVDKGRKTARAATSWRNRDSTRVGDFVCHRGEKTGYSCATVEFVDFAPPGDLCAGPCTPTWVAVKGPDCGKGDSGGPVFSGTVALGLMKGASYSGDDKCQLYYYMSTDYLPQGWTVLTPGRAAVLAAAHPEAVEVASVPAVGGQSLGAMRR